MSTHGRDRFLANWASQARKGVLELIVMSALAGREFYGYELVEHITGRAGVAVADGTLYAILTRLKGEGLVDTRWETADRGPPRKYYALTEQGRAALAGMRKEWSAIVHGVSAIRPCGGDDRDV
jgi:PadR family transcriptional regulator PadR